MNEVQVQLQGSLPPIQVFHGQLFYCHIPTEYTCQWFPQPVAASNLISTLWVQSSVKSQYKHTIILQEMLQLCRAYRYVSAIPIMCEEVFRELNEQHTGKELMSKCGTQRPAQLVRIRKGIKGAVVLSSFVCRTSMSQTQPCLTCPPFLKHKSKRCHVQW